MNEKERVAEQSERYDRDGTRNDVPTKVEAPPKFPDEGLSFNEGYERSSLC